jgi:opacity protein-like surface antigen
MKTTLLSLALAAGLLAPAQTADGKVQRTVPAVFTASETFDVGMDTSSPVADDYFNKAPFKFQGTLKQLHFKNLPGEQPAFAGSPDDD